MNETIETRERKINVSGIIFTIIVTISFAFAMYMLLDLSKGKNSLSIREIQENEIAAYKNLKLISAAQEKYIQKDWDGNGKKSYAVFYVHLWHSIAQSGEPIPVNLIPKNLAFAMDVSNPLQGYYYVDLRKWRLDLHNRQELDYEKEWAVAASPGIYRGTGFLTFIVSQSGVVYAGQKMHSEPEYPRDPIKNGWTKIASSKQLREFQQTIPYPQK